ncbi:MAG: SDR family oxidoreductase [Pseudomonadota bacterium]
MTDLPTTPSFRLDGRRALVTGAGRGLGLAMAVALAEAGAQTLLIARSADQVEAAAEALRGRGLAAQAAAVDVTDRAAMRALIEARGPFHVLVNNAGLARHAPFLETTEADYDAVTDLNVRAAYFVAQSVAQGLIAAGETGSIINLSSQMGHVGGPERAVYCASKHAMEGFSKAMALELAPHGIRVNTLCPTFIATELAAQTLRDPQKRAWIERSIPLGRVGALEDLMGPVVFLASEASALVTGSALMVDGGWTAA